MIVSTLFWIALFALVIWAIARWLTAGVVPSSGSASALGVAHPWAPALVR